MENSNIDGGIFSTVAFSTQNNIFLYCVVPIIRNIKTYIKNSLY